MFDCAADVLGYHNDEVTLPQPERTAMKGRRDANRTRLEKGLKEEKKPLPEEFHSQGSYEMKSMTQHPDNDYDIDDGVYFAKEDLVGPRGGEMSALEVRQMVRDALDDGSFNTPPKLHTNCVRVQYEAGYQVDVPSYRRVTVKDHFGQEVTHYELAGSDWKRSDARDVTDWFDVENMRQSPDESNGRQLRRISRLIKKYSKSRASWAPLILGGFGITKLVTECYCKDADREDRALYYTMKSIRDRLTLRLAINHPVTPNETITSGDDDPKARLLKEKLSDAIEWLSPIFDTDCTRNNALKCWDKVFDTTYFSARGDKEEKSTAANSSTPAFLTSGMLKDIGSAASPSVSKVGGGRYA